MITDELSKIMGAAPTRADSHTVLKAHWLDTLLGPMLAIADEHALLLLAFVERRGLEREIERLRQKTKSAIVPGKAEPIQSIEKEISAYFSGELVNFKTPIKMLGSDFQKKVWHELINIPAGETRSYADIANAIGQPTACRAVANANGANQLAIIIPCHRVINSDGKLGGYGGGVSRKEWLLGHEKEQL